MKIDSEQLPFGHQYIMSFPGGAVRGWSVAKLWPTLCSPMDCSPPGSSVHKIFQARTLKWLPFPSPGVFLTQGSIPCLLLCRWILYLLSHGKVVKNLPANAGDARDLGWIPGMGRSLGEGNGKPLQYSCLENPTDRGSWWATVHGVTKSRVQLSKHLRDIVSTLTKDLCIWIQLPMNCLRT